MHFVYWCKLRKAVIQFMSDQIRWLPSLALLRWYSIWSVFNSCAQLSHGASEPSVVKKDNSHGSFAWTEYMWPLWHRLSSLCLSFTYKGGRQWREDGGFACTSVSSCRSSLYVCVPVLTLCNSLSSFASFYIDWLLECNRRDLRNGTSRVWLLLIVIVLNKTF